MARLLVVLALALLATRVRPLEFSEDEFPGPKQDGEDDDDDDDEEVPRPSRGPPEAGLAKDTPQRRNPQARGNSLKELWEVVPLKQQQQQPGARGQGPEARPGQIK